MQEYIHPSFYNDKQVISIQPTDTQAAHLTYSANTAYYKYIAYSANTTYCKSQCTRNMFDRATSPTLAFNHTINCIKFVKMFVPGVICLPMTL